MPSSLPAPVTTNLAAEFPLADGLIHLNHAALAPWPRRTVEAIEGFTRHNLHRSMSDYGPWIEVERRLRDRLVALIGARGSHEVALLKNTSEALSTVAFGLDWQEGENVVLAREEFPSNRAPWESLADRGVEVRLVEIGLSSEPEALLLAHCDEHTRLVATSSVHFSTGVRVDLDRLGQQCRQRDILLCVDAIQSLGVLPMDVQASGIDFLAGGSHKWLLSPEGVGFLYCREDLVEQIPPLARGWRMGPAPFDFEKPDWGPARSARRFECGTMNTLGMVALDASLELLAEVGGDHLQEAILSRTDWLMAACSELPGLQEVTPADRSRRAGIVSLSGESAETGYRTLRSAGVISAIRDGRLRLSPHFYTPIDHLERVVELLQEAAR